AVADDYYLSHGHSLSKTDMNSLHQYVYLNRLDPSALPNWKTAFDRLTAAGVIKQEAPKTAPAKPVPVQQESEPQGRKWIDVEKMASRTPDERNALKAAMYNNIMMEAQPIVDQFFADLENAGHSLTTDEKYRLQAWVYEHNLFPHQRASWE